MIREEKRKERELSRRYTLNAKQYAEAGESDEESNLGEEDNTEEREAEDEEAMVKKLFLRLCVVNEVLGLVDPVSILFPSGASLVMTVVSHPKRMAYYISSRSISLGPRWACTRPTSKLMGV